MINEILYKKIKEMKRDYNIIAIKSEFEAEGSTFRDICRLRILTSRVDTSLYLKIGGYEAVRDIIDSLELDVDGIVVPMVENAFNIKKFYQSYEMIYNGEDRFIGINIESDHAIRNIDEIFSICSDLPFSGVTFGRSDLTASYGNNLSVEDDVITNTIIEYGKRFKDIGYKVTMGGSVSTDTIDTIRNNPELLDVIDRMETRKVVFDPKMLSEKILRDIFDFERYYIMYKKEISDIVIQSEMKRLTDLERRIR